MAKIEEKIWRIRKQRKISKWRKQISVLAEMGTRFDNGKLNRKKKDDFKNYKMENINDITQMTETMGRKLQTQAHTFKT